MKTKVKLHGADFANDLFRPHGEYSSHLEGNLIQTVATGPFNSEMLKAHRKLAVPLFVEAGRQGRFGVLTEYRGSMLAGFDAIEVYAETMAMVVRETANFAGIANLADPDVEGREMMAYHFEQKAFLPIGVPYKMFDNRLEAEGWLKCMIGQTG